MMFCSVSDLSAKFTPPTITICRKPPSFMIDDVVADLFDIYKVKRIAEFFFF